MEGYYFLKVLRNRLPSEKVLSNIKELGIDLNLAMNEIDLLIAIADRIRLLDSNYDKMVYAQQIFGMRKANYFLTEYVFDDIRSELDRIEIDISGKLILENMGKSEQIIDELRDFSEYSYYQELLNELEKELKS